MSNDMKTYQSILKENIGKLIENNQLEVAKELVNQYENIVKKDIDIYSIKGVIAMMEGDLDRAEKVLIEGIAKDRGNFDLNYNLAYLYQLKENKDKAIVYYKKALSYVEDKEVGEGIYKTLQELGVKESKIEIIERVTKEEKNLSEPIKENVTPSEELEIYKKQLKVNIQSLVEQGLLKEAKVIITEYEEIVKDDVDIYSIKGVIAMMEGDMDEAEEILKKGLNIQFFNYDLLYNLAYLYEIQEKHITAYRYYKKIIKVADEEMIREVRKKIRELEKIKDVGAYIKRKKVLFVAHIFPPVGGSGVQRSLKFVKYLRDFGWEPIVVTVGKTRYPLKDEIMKSEIPSEIEIIRIDEAINIDLKYANKLIQLYSGVINNNDLMKEYIEELNKSQEHLNQLLFIPDPYIVWAAEVLDQIDDQIDFKEIDMIYTTSGPYSDHIIGYYLKQKYNKPWVADFRDEWTNNPYVEFNKNHIWYKINFAMENNIVHKADNIITVTPLSKQNYEKNFQLESHKVHEITNGYDEADFKNIKRANSKSEKFTIAHNGMLYMIRTPLTFMQAIQRLIESGKISKTKIRAVFGWIENREKWIETRDELGLTDVVEFLDYMPHIKSLELTNNADVLLLIVGAGEKNKSVFPGKIFEYLRLCKPIIALSPQGSVVEELIGETGRGYNIDFNNIEDISKAILKLYKLWEKGQLPRLRIDNKVRCYERKRTTERLSEVFSRMCSENKVKQIDQVDKNKHDIAEKESEFYDRLFERGGLDQTYFKHYSETFYFEIWSQAVQLIKKINNPNIIEIGCGPGQFANLLFDSNIKKYQGIDFSEEAIKYAKIRNDKYRKLFNIDNAYTTNLFNKEYNTVIIFEVLEHVNEDLKILSRIKENSHILFSVPNFYSEGHVRWFNSKQDIIERYKKYIEFENIFTFSVGGNNKIFLIKGKVKENKYIYMNSKVIL